MRLRLPGGFFAEAAFVDAFLEAFVDAFLDVIFPFLLDAFLP